MKDIIYYIAILIIAVFIILTKTFSPIWLLIFTIAILWPQRKDSRIHPVFLFSILLFLLFFVFNYFAILVPFIVGMGIAYILAPVVGLLERKKVPKVLAILIFLIPIIAFVPFIIFLVVSGLVNELQSLVDKIPAAINQLQLFFSAVINRLIELGLEIDPNIIANTITTYLSNIIGGIFKTLGQIGKGIGGIIILLYNLVFIPLSAYLFLADREGIGDWFRNQFSQDEREKVARFITQLNFSFARFFRGQIILMLIVGFIVGFSLWILGIKYYLLLGIVAGVCNLIPNIGYILSFIPAIIIGALSPAPLVNLIKIGSVYIGEQLLENFYLGPVIIGKASRLHPVVVMIVLILGGAIFGFWGVLLAVPITIFIREFLNYFLNLRL